MAVFIVCNLCDVHVNISTTAQYNSFSSKQYIIGLHVLKIVAVVCTSV
jgi:hypothetical protein